MKRPKKLLYGADETPSVLTRFFFGIQHATLMGIMLVFTVTITNAANVSALTAASVVSATLLASIFGSLIMSSKRIGAGRLLPLSSNPVYLAPSLLAAAAGGLPMVFAMTLFSGLIQLPFTWILKRMRIFFPAEIIGVLLTLIGLELCMMGLKNLFILSAAELIESNIHLYILIGVLALTVLYISAVWFKSTLRLYSLLIVYVLAYLAVYLTSGMNLQTLNTIAQSQWFFIPHLNLTQYTFNRHLIFPFFVAAIVCICKVMGSISALQRIEDDSWKEPDLKNIASANLADSVATIFSGLLGGTGLNVSTSSTALTLETLVASRKIMYFTSALLLVMAFSQKFALIMVYTPKPILGAILFFMGTNIIVSGLTTLAPHFNRTRSMLVVGISFLIGFSYGVFPNYYDNLPNLARSFSGSMIALATVVGVILNSVLRKRHKLPAINDH